jgi:hypothetical protein
MPDIAELKSGMRLRSQVCSTEVIVIRPGRKPVRLECGGALMTPMDVARIADGRPEARFSGGSKLGKRYTHPRDDSLEILVTKEGAGSLSDGPVELVIKQSRQLPASD